MSTIGRRFAVLATLVALMAAPMVAEAAAPAAADDLATIAMSISPSGDVPVGQAMTVTIDWGINFEPIDDPVPIEFDFAIPTGFRVDGGAPTPCVVSPSGTATGIVCSYADVRDPPAEFNIAVTAVSESYNATFSAGLSSPDGFGDNDALTIDSYVPGVSADVHPLRFDAPNPLVVGQSFTLAGSAANAGTTTMHGVTATIDLRAPLRLDGATWGVLKHPCTISGLRATCAIGTVFGHFSVPVAVSATPTAKAASTTATVKVTSTTPEQQPDPLPDTVTLTRPVKPAIADLGVSVNLPSTQPIVDAPSAASIVVTNHGTVDAAGVGLSFTTSSGYDVVLGRAFWTCTQSGQKFTCIVGNASNSPPLAPGASQSIDFTVTPRNATSGTLSASVTTTSAEPAPDPTPDSAAATIPAAAPASADLVLTADSLVDLVVGSAADLGIGVANHGPSLARNVHLVVTYPSGWSISAATPQAGACAVAQSKATCDLGDVKQSFAPTFVLVTAAPSTAGAGQRVNVAATSSTSDPGGHPHTSFSYNVVDQPALSVASPGSVPEGSVAQIPLRLSLPSPKTVSVTCSTGSWTATAGADFVQTTQTVTFDPGVTTADLDVTTLQDSLDEADVEVAVVSCGNVVNAKLANPDPHGLQSVAFGIVDDDPLPTVVPGSVSQSEGAATTISVPITLSAPSGRTVTASWNTEDQTAKAGSDYTATSGTVTFAPGETTKYVTVTVLNDSVPEPDEVFLIRFTSVTNATLGGYYGLGFAQILNDD